jgi:membrane-associated phospholipid phosphatase
LNRTLATILSSVFHPLLVPSYLVAVLAYGFPPALLPLAAAARWQVLLLVWGLTFWLPGLGVWLLVRSGRVSSVELYERRQRPVPLLLAAGTFAAATALTAWVPAYQAPLLTLVLGGITAAVLLTLFITFWWKISAHGVGMGGAVGLLALLLVRPYPTDGQAAGWLAATGLAAAAVAWARLRLQAHTPAQVWAGLGLGAALVLGVGLGAALS